MHTQAMIEAHLMRPEIIPDLHTKMRVQSLVQELLWKLAEVSVEGRGWEMRSERDAAIATFFFGS